jgi:hypothetical protein
VLTSFQAGPVRVPPRREGPVPDAELPRDVEAAQGVEQEQEPARLWDVAWSLCWRVRDPLGLARPDRDYSRRKATPWVRLAGVTPGVLPVLELDAGCWGLPPGVGRAAWAAAKRFAAGLPADLLFEVPGVVLRVERHFEPALRAPARVRA